MSDFDYAIKFKPDDFYGHYNRGLTSLSGYSARWFELRSKDSTRVFHLLFLWADNRFHCLMTSSDGNDPALLYTRRFFESFRVIKPGA